MRVAAVQRVARGTKEFGELSLEFREKTCSS